MLTTVLFFTVSEIYINGYINDIELAISLVFVLHLNVIGDLSFSVGIKAFMNKIAEKEISGTYITVFSSAVALGFLGGRTMVLFIAESQ